MNRITGVVLMAGLMAVGCQPPANQGTGEKATTVDTAAIAQAEQRIHELNREWVQAVARGDTAAIVDLYTEDGRLMAPGGPAAVGHEALREAWGGVLSMADTLTFSTEVLEVSPSASMAYDIGSYRMVYPTPEGELSRDLGKYVVVWEKVDGEWKVAVDIFNSNQPPGGGGGGE